MTRWEQRLLLLCSKNANMQQNQIETKFDSDFIFEFFFWSLSLYLAISFSFFLFLYLFSKKLLKPENCGYPIFLFLFFILLLLFAFKIHKKSLATTEQWNSLPNETDLGCFISVIFFFFENCSKIHSV